MCVRSRACVLATALSCHPITSDVGAGKLGEVRCPCPEVRSQMAGSLTLRLCPSSFGVPSLLCEERVVGPLLSMDIPGCCKETAPWGPPAAVDYPLPQERGPRPRKGKGKSRILPAQSGADRGGQGSRRGHGCLQLWQMHSPRFSEQTPYLLGTGMEAWAPF